MRSEEYEVLSVLLRCNYVSPSVDRNQQLVIVEETSSDIWVCCEALALLSQDTSKTKSFAGLKKETVDDFLKVDGQSEMLQRRLNVPVPYELVASSKLERSSNSYIEVSRVGLDEARSQALVSSYWYSNPLASHLELHFLAKTNGAWNILQTRTIMVS